MDDEPVLAAVAPVLSIPTIQDLTENNILPEDICEDFDQMIQNKPIENQILVFLPNEMVNYDALREMILHIYQLKESIRWNSAPLIFFNLDFYLGPISKLL